MDVSLYNCTIGVFIALLQIIVLMMKRSAVTNLSADMPSVRVVINLCVARGKGDLLEVVTAQTHFLTEWQTVALAIVLFARDIKIIVICTLITTITIINVSISIINNNNNNYCKCIHY